MEKMSNHKLSQSSRDLQLHVSTTDMKNLRDGLDDIARTEFTWTELMLAIASLTGGTALGIIGGGGIGTGPTWWLLVLLVITAGALVGYFVLRRVSSSVPSARARDLVKILENARSSPLDQLVGQWRLSSSTKTSGKESTGTVNVNVLLGRLSAKGMLYGQSQRPIAHLSSEICDYDDRTHRFVLVYILSANNDNGNEVLSRCFFDGLLFESEKDVQIKGSWVHLEGDGFGSRPWGHATFVREQ